MAAIIRKSIFIFLGSFALFLVLILPFYFFGELYGASEFFSKFSFLDFILGHEWSLPEQKYGALQAIYGTLITAGLALLITTPVSIAAAVAMSELLPEWLSERLGIIVDMIAAIPSVVVGLWGILSLGPFLSDTLYKFLMENLGFLPIFQTTTLTAYNKLTAALILGYMIMPFAVSVIKENLRLVPLEIKEAAYALGFTKWEVIRIMLSYIKPGIFAALMLALGRAVAEAVAVSMVIGNTCNFSISLLEPACTLTTLIINNFAEATGTEAAALIGLGLVLFIISISLVLISRLIYSKVFGGYMR
ncbi:MAG: phosphate ABC transporter permease subunit PstC [Nitrososphaerota archaeon]|nr:phosphate ABC transporter permease subunit PstC [Aigarchaeota archaeon]MDW8076293.1 phosphate ABC transporter permease subunit PstC [Nitrososphaerota archaeon]